MKFYCCYQFSLHPLSIIILEFKFPKELKMNTNEKTLSIIILEFKYWSIFKQSITPWL